jgi:hypothetical protein
MPTEFNDPTIPIDDTEKIMVDNLKETLKSAQTYLLIGNGAALFLLILATQGRLSRPQEENINIPFVGLSAPTYSAAFVALVIYTLSGILVLILYRGARRIAAKLRESKTRGLLNAVLTYPSLLGSSKTMGVGSTLVAALLGIGALTVSFFPRNGAAKAMLPGIIVSFPYLYLSWKLFREPETLA